MMSLVIQFRRWMFSLPTKSIELICGGIGFGFAIVFLLNGEILRQDTVYGGFVLVDKSWIWLLLLFTSTIQLFVTRFESLKARQLSAILLKCLGFCWTLAAVLFGWKLAINTALVTYTILAVAALLAAFHLDEVNRLEEIAVGNDNRKK